jgi:hypothetical protein
LATVPRAPAGTVDPTAVDVVVTNGDGQSVTFVGAYTYVPAPSITGINPVTGDPGQIMTITGTGFDPDKANIKVEFGFVEATNVVSSSSTQIEVEIPSGTGVVSIIVTNLVDGQRDYLFDCFGYGSPYPDPDSVFPMMGTAGTMVEIIGTGFLRSSRVQFGVTGNYSASVTFVDEHRLLAVAPAGTGEVEIVVENPGTPVKRSGTLGFWYQPLLSSISPDNCRFDTAGAPVTLTGGNFRISRIVVDTDVLSSRLVWKFDQVDVPAAGQTPDGSGFPNHGTLRGGPTHLPAGGLVVDQVTETPLGAIDFDGVDDYVDSGMVASGLGIDGNKEKSFSLWANARSSDGGGVFDLGVSSVLGQAFGLATLNPSPNQWCVRFGGGALNDITFDTAASGITSDNTWTHFVVTYDGTDVKVWANGTEIASAPKALNIMDQSSITGTMTFTSDSVTVGGAGTSFLTELRSGDFIRVNATEPWYEIDQVLGNTQLTLLTDYVRRPETFETVTNVAGGEGLGNFAGTYNVRIAMSFQLASDATAVNVHAWLAKIGTPGDITVRIETDAGNQPSGTLVTGASLGPILEADVGVGSWVTATLGGNVPLTAGTTYWLVFELPADPLAGSYYAAWGDATDGYAGGKYMYRTGAAWSDGTQILDMAFRVGANVSVAGTAEHAGTFRVGECYGNKFDGVIDDVRVYSRALTGEEISWIYWASQGAAYHKPAVWIGPGQVDTDLREGFGVTWDPAEVPGGVDPWGAVSVVNNLYFTVPAAAAGTVDVTVMNPDGGIAALADGFTYNPPPVITSIDPESGPIDTIIFVWGYGFMPTMRVWFDGKECTTIYWGGDDRWRSVNAPVHPVGTFADVIVQNPDGQISSTADILPVPVKFEYTP